MKIQPVPEVRNNCAPRKCVKCGNSFVDPREWSICSRCLTERKNAGYYLDKNDPERPFRVLAYIEKDDTRICYHD